LRRFAAAFFSGGSEQHAGLIAIFCEAIAAAGVQLAQSDLCGHISLLDGSPQQVNCDCAVRSIRFVIQVPLCKGEILVAEVGNGLRRPVYAGGLQMQARF
jgi:hypothetical protein